MTDELRKTHRRHHRQGARHAVHEGEPGHAPVRLLRRRRLRSSRRSACPFETVNILADQELREGLKEYSSWPTFPQLYVDGKLVGGADIVRDLHARGELKRILAA